MRLVVKFLIVIVIIAAAFAIGAISMNGVPLTSKPGLVQRLSLYLTRNQVESAPDHPIPELRPRNFNRPAEALFHLLQQVVVDLGWRIETTEPLQYRLHAVVTTRLLRFKDDVRVIVEPVDTNTGRLLVHASSRVGRADYGANLGHVIALQQALTSKLEE